MNIPKTIHYCWFGPEDIPEKELKCIKSWVNTLPDYELMFWNEKSFDVKTNKFAAQAYEKNAYAFVSDYVRTKVLYHHGGVYLDTDVEVFEAFNGILKNDKCFLGFETRSQVGTAVMRFTPKHPVIKAFLDFYEGNNFINRRGEFNTIANVSILTDILKTRGLIVDGNHQTLDDIEVYAREYFYPKKISDLEFKISDETVAIHKCSNSWMTERERRRGRNTIWIKKMRPILRGIRKSGRRLLGENVIMSIEVRVRNILK
jgi:mannosyltransferase OCH1-like enzyme